MSGLTRRHFERGAALVRRLSSNPDVSDAITLEVAGLLADMYADDNPRFDRDKFFHACMRTETAA